MCGACFKHRTCASPPHVPVHPWRVHDWRQADVDAQAIVENAYALRLPPAALAQGRCHGGERDAPTPVFGDEGIDAQPQKRGIMACFDIRHFVIQTLFGRAGSLGLDG